METVRSLIARLLPAVVVAAGVTLLAAGLVTYLGPPVDGVTVTATPSSVAARPSPSPSPSPTPRPTRSVFPEATPSPTPTATPGAPATRVVVPALGIDLPVVAGDFQVPGNVGNYPLCDVAQYLSAPGLVQPGVPGTTYLYGHAREGMFLPLLEASQVEDGAGMIGALVQVYAADGVRYLYEIDEVKRHATDFSIAETEPGEHYLVLQTSEGPSGTVPKLQVGARPLSSERVDPVEANPTPEPSICA